MLDDEGWVSVHCTAMPETFVPPPRSTVRLPPCSFGSGAQIVALLPSTAASAYIPASSELAVAALQRARLLVGVRSGLRVGIVSDPLSVCVPAGVSTVKAAPLRSVTLVVLGPMSMSKVLPCH